MRPLRTDADAQGIWPKIGHIHKILVRMKTRIGLIFHSLDTLTETPIQQRYYLKTMVMVNIHTSFVGRHDAMEQDNTWMSAWCSISVSDQLAVSTGPIAILFDVRHVRSDLGGIVLFLPCTFWYPYKPMPILASIVRYINNDDLCHSF